MTFWDHLDELRGVLIRCALVILLGAIAAFCFHDRLFTLLLAPVKEPVYLFSPLEGFVIALKLSFWGGIILTSPLWLLFLIQFFLPALHRREKNLLLPFLGLSLLFMGGGILFAYKITLPLVIPFFQHFNTSLGENLWSLGKTVDFLLNLILAHGIVFELYVALIFTVHFGLLNSLHLKKGRKGVIVSIFILAAILTPPDLISQLLLALPMLLFYETTVLYAKLKDSSVRNPHS